MYSISYSPLDYKFNNIKNYVYQGILDYFYMLNRKSGSTFNICLYVFSFP